MDSLLSPACCLKVGNEVFGFARFSKAVQAVQIVFSDGNPGLLDQISAILSTRLQSLIFLCNKISRCVRTQFETTIASIGFKPTCCAAKFRSGDRVIPMSASAFQGRHPPRRGECLESARFDLRSVGCARPEVRTITHNHAAFGCLCSHREQTNPRQLRRSSISPTY